MKGQAVMLRSRLRGTCGRPTRGRAAIGGRPALGFTPAYLAKWFARSGFEDFYRAVWRDLAIRSELEARLRRSGALRLVHDLLDS